MVSKFDVLQMSDIKVHHLYLYEISFHVNSMGNIDVSEMLIVKCTFGSTVLGIMGVGQ